MRKYMAGIVVILIIAGFSIFPPQEIRAAYKTIYSHLYKETDIPYGNLSEFQKLDIYWPDKFDGPYPVIVSIHGGGYCAGDKTGSDAMVAWEGLQRGYAVVAVNYRLSTEATFPAQINDVKAAIRFIKAHAHEYDLNPDKIAVWGASAGGTLSALVGATADAPELSDPSLGNEDQSERVQAVVDWCGPINLLTMDEQYKASGVKGFPTNTPTSYGSKYLGRLVTEVPELAKQANPESYITPDDPPVFIQHGTKDNWVPVQQSIEYAAKLRAVLGNDKVYLEIMPGVSHGGQAFNNSENVAKVLDFLDSVLKK
ncbi:MAG: alpha/beta hydrolase [Syntrophomonadaceae bacterium]|nr:alpha/beta hydrolase [Syntrophomonadaceae bacterium]